MDKNSFYRSELRALFVKYNVEQNVELINHLAQIIGAKDRATQGVNDAVQSFASSCIEGDGVSYADILDLQQIVYGIVWQSCLEK